MTEVNRASCLILNDNKLLLVKSKKEACWKLPGSRIESEYTEEDNAVSGTEEATGLKAKIIQLFGIYETQRNAQNFEEKVFEANLESDELSPSENIEAKWFDIKKSKNECLDFAVEQVLDDL